MGGTIVVVVRITSCRPCHIEGREVHGQMPVTPQLSVKCHMVF